VEYTLCATCGMSFTLVFLTGKWGVKLKGICSFIHRSSKKSCDFFLAYPAVEVGLAWGEGAPRPGGLTRP
jgi:hypothetical protein